MNLENITHVRDRDLHDHDDEHEPFIILHVSVIVSLLH